MFPIKSILTLLIKDFIFSYLNKCDFAWSKKMPMSIPDKTLLHKLIFSFFKGD